MAPDRYAPLLSAALDGELGRFRRWRMARHLKTCPSCAAKLEAMQTMQVALRDTLIRHRAPPGLAQRIGNTLPRESVVPPARPRWRLVPLAGTGLAGALAGAALTLLVVGGSLPQGTTTSNATSNATLTEAVLDSYIGSLVTGHFTDVAASDQHAVKPWLSARLDVSPPALDLGTEGYELIGGRVAYFSGHRRAAVVYRRGEHVINLFAWAAADPSDEKFRRESRQGYNLIFWRRDGIEYAAVSDVEMDQLARFASLVEGAGCSLPASQMASEGGSGPVRQNAAEGSGVPLPQKAAEASSSLAPQKTAAGDSTPVRQNAAEGGSGPSRQNAAESGSGPSPRNSGSMPCKG